MKEQHMCNKKHNEPKSTTTKIVQTTGAGLGVYAFSEGLYQHWRQMKVQETYQFFKNFETHMKSANGHFGRFIQQSNLLFNKTKGTSLYQFLNNGSIRIGYNVPASAYQNIAQANIQNSINSLYSGLSSSTNLNQYAPNHQYLESLKNIAKEYTTSYRHYHTVSAEAVQQAAKYPNIAQFQTTLTQIEQFFISPRHQQATSKLVTQISSLYSDSTKMNINVRQAHQIFLKLEQVSKAASHYMNHLHARVAPLLRDRSVLQAAGIIGAGGFAQMCSSVGLGIRTGAIFLLKGVGAIFTAKVIAAVAVIGGVVAYFTNYRGFGDFVKNSFSKLTNSIKKQWNALFANAQQPKKKETAELPPPVELIRYDINMASYQESDLEEEQTSFESEINKGITPKEETSVLHMDSYVKTVAVALEKNDIIYLAPSIMNEGNPLTTKNYYVLRKGKTKGSFKVYALEKHKNYLFVPQKNNHYLVDAQFDPKLKLSKEIKQVNLFQKSATLTDYYAFQENSKTDAHPEELTFEDIMDHEKFMADSGMYIITPIMNLKNIMFPVVKTLVTSQKEITDKKRIDIIVDRAKELSYQVMMKKNGFKLSRNVNSLSLSSNAH